MFYLIFNLLLFVFTFTFLSSLNLPNKKKEKFLFIQLTVQLLYIHIFKDYTSLPDLTEYVIGYNYTNTLDFDRIYQLKWYHKFEIGWCYLNYLLTRIHSHHIVLFIVTSLVIVGSYSRLSWKYSMYPLFSLFIFCFLIYGQSLFVLRQHMAMALCFITIPFILERKPKQFFLIVLLSFLIHKTAIIFSIIYFIYPLKLNKKFILTLFLGGVFLGLFLNFIISIMSVFITGYEGYITDEDAEGTNLTTPLIQCCVLGLFFISSLKINLLCGLNKLLFQMLLIAIILSFSTIGFNSIIGRLNMYYTSMIFLTIPNFLYFYQGPFKWCIKTLIFVMFVVLFFKSTEHIKNIVLISPF